MSNPITIREVTYLLGDSSKTFEIGNGGTFWLAHTLTRESAQKFAAVDDLIIALKRAVTLLRATADFVKGNPLVEECDVFYDKATCDGFCLRDDCEIAITEADSALAKAEGGGK